MGSRSAVTPMNSSSAFVRTSRLVRAKRRELRERNNLLDIREFPPGQRYPMAWERVLGVTSKPSYHRGFRRDPTALCGDVECGTRQSRPWPSPSMGARIAQSENLDKAPEGAGWEDSYASRARSDGRFAQTSLFTSLRPGAD